MAERNEDKNMGAPEGEHFELAADHKVDINTASIEEIMKLAPQMGRKRAEFIVKFRNVAPGGKFKSMDDLNQIPGLGRELINTMKLFADAK